MKGSKKPKADEMAHATDFRRFKDKNDKKPAYVPWFEAVLSDIWHFRRAFKPLRTHFRPAFLALYRPERFQKNWNARLSASWV